MIAYGLDAGPAKLMQLNGPRTLRFTQTVDRGNHAIYINFLNKLDSESDLAQGKDMAVEIAKVTIEGMTLDRFRWAGLYYPRYPEPWAGGQTNLKPVVKSATYLGWNGRWELPFTTPIFTWIHQLEGLGWLYPVD